jgi:hypothetical protein
LANEFSKPVINPSASDRAVAMAVVPSGRVVVNEFEFNKVLI